MTISRRIPFAILGVLLAGCTRPSTVDLEVRLPPARSLREPKLTSGPISSSDSLECFLLNVSGPGLTPSSLPHYPGAGLQTTVGRLSPVIARAAGSEPAVLHMSLPAGDSR